jgi:HAD superfamily hydrolase (TIGR01509 family)
MIRAVIFDLGGVLVYTENAYIHALYDCFTHHKIPLPPRGKVIKNVGITDYDFIERSLPNGYRTKNNADKCYEKFKQIFPLNYLDELKEIEGAREILEYLHKNKIKKALATGFDKDTAQKILDLYMLSQLFDIKITREDFEKPRPEPDIVLAAIKELKKLGIKRDECLYVDDTINGTKSGKAAKVKVVTVLSGAQSELMRDIVNDMLEKGETDYVLESVKLLKYILD